MSGLFQDFKLGFRMLLRQPVLTTVVIATLALGIGFSAAIFSLAKRIFLDPIPAVHDPQSIAAIFGKEEGGAVSLPISYPNYKDLRDLNKSFSSLAAYQVSQVGTLVGGEPDRVWIEMVSSNYLSTLGVNPVLGRDFHPEDDATPGASPVTILSYRFWQNNFSGRGDIIGQTVRLNGHPFTVIGVAPETFRGSNVVLATAAWVPTMMYQQVFAFADFFEQRGARVVQVLGRLRPGTSNAQAQAEASTLASRLEKLYPDDNKGMKLSLVPFLRATLPMDRRTGFLRTGVLLSCMVAILLLIACINVANILVTRTLSRGKEISVRLSLGSGRWRLARQLLVESLILALAAGLASLFVGVWCMSLLWKLRPPYVVDGAVDLGLSLPLLAASFALTVVVAVLVGAAPVVQAFRTKSLPSLRQGGAASSETGRGIPVRRLVVAVQVALSLICLACGGIFLGSLRNAQRVNPGFLMDGLAAVSFDLKAQGYDAAQGEFFQQQLLERVRNMPGVQVASLAENRPLSGWSWWRRVPTEAKQSAGEEGVMAGSLMVDSSYFQALHVPLVHGRAFEPQDRADTRPVAIVNETLAKAAWPGRDPVGLSVKLDEEATPTEIVGVARDVKYRSLGEDPQPFLYLPLQQRKSLRVALLVRSEHPETLVHTLEREVHRLDGELPISESGTLAEIFSRSLWAPRAGAVVLSLFGLVALILAAIGVYGVTSFSAGQRKAEIGLRMALGANRKEVVRMIVRQGMLYVAFGLAAGLAVSWAIDHWVQGLIYTGQHADWLSVAISAGILVAVGYFANLFPARRASLIDPLATIRTQ